MAKISSSRIKAEDFEKEEQELVSKISFILNPFFDQLTFAFNKNITIDDNLNAEFKLIQVTVDNLGIPLQDTSFTTNIATKLKGAIVVMAYSDLGNFSKKFDKTITNISVSSPTIITTSSNHNLNVGDFVTIKDSNSTPSMDGIHQIIPVEDNKIQVAKNVTVAGSSGILSLNKSNFVSSAPFITFLQTNKKVIINHVTGLEPNIKYTLNLLILG